MRFLYELSVEVQLAEQTKSTVSVDLEASASSGAFAAEWHRADLPVTATNPQQEFNEVCSSKEEQSCGRIFPFFLFSASPFPCFLLQMCNYKYTRICSSSSGHTMHCLVKHASTNIRRPNGRGCVCINWQQFICKPAGNPVSWGGDVKTLSTRCAQKGQLSKTRLSPGQLSQDSDAPKSHSQVTYSHA